MLTLSLAAAYAGCFERGDRWLDPPAQPPVCTIGEQRCTAALERCELVAGAAGWAVVDDCAARELVCAPSLLRCTRCLPDTQLCEGQDVLACAGDGETTSYVSTCDTTLGSACRAGSCVALCAQAAVERSNVGCEYWAVDLDNANIDATSNAAAQQFAVVVSNPQPDVPVDVRVFQDDTLPGEPNAPLEIGRVTIAPQNLEVFKLGPREVDGSAPGSFDTGTHTALSRAAFRIESDFPVVAYQFNPLENVSVFSNDASLLYPTESLGQGTLSAPSYVVVGWPQTIAATDDPNTNFNPLDPIHLRAALTIVGTRERTRVVVEPSTRVVPGGPVAESGPGDRVEVELGPYDVLNLETGDFRADFSGSLVYADQPVAVFVGGEASDAPSFATLATRRCCADHLEDQLAPVRTAGKRFAIPHTPHRGDAVREAGADLTSIPEPDYVRFLAVGEAGATITTSLPPPDDRLVLSGRGSFAEITAYGDFVATSDAPVLVAQVMASQQATSVGRNGLPGGDPSLMFVPPLEQARSEYVFLTPDKYAFDFVTIVAPRDALVLLDDQEVGPELCERTPADGLSDEERGGPTELVVYRCQLSYPTIDPSVDPPLIGPGLQNDGVHRVAANAPVFVAITGFDAYVSYAYAAGTELRELGIPQ